MQVLGPAGQVLFHQREADPLRDTALDLAPGKGGVDHPAKVMRGGDLQEAYCAKGLVDFKFHNLRAVAIQGVGRALSVSVQPRGWRVIGFLGRKRVAKAVGGQMAKVNARLGTCVTDDNMAANQRKACAIACVGPAQDFGPQSLGRRLGRAARHEGLPAGRGLARIRAERRIGADQVKACQRQAQRLCCDLGDDRV